MTGKQKTVLQNWHRKHQGFGEEHTSAEWAKILGLHRNTMQRYFKSGLTVPEICELRDITYPTK